MMDGDDRRSFLRSQPTSLLYWWDMLDKEGILFRVAAILDDNTGSSSAKTPAPVNRRSTSGSKRAGANKTKSDDAKMLKSHADLNRHVENTVREMRLMNENTWREQLGKLRRELLQLRLQHHKATKEGEEHLVDLFTDEMKRVEAEMRKLEAMLEGDEAHQRLSFGENAETV